LSGCEGGMRCQNLTETARHSSGVLATARRQGHTEQLEKPSPPLVSNHRSKVGLITGDTGKWTEDGKVADGCV
jgi:hypothetical protein